MGKLRVYLMETEESVGNTIIKVFQDLDKQRDYELVGWRKEVRLESIPTSEMDAVILDPRALPRTFGPFPVLRVIRKLLPKGTTLVMHWNHRALQEFREACNDPTIAISHGFVRGDWKRLFRMLERIRKARL